jgi:hypothetical protein
MSAAADDRQAILEELAAALEARRELGERMEPQLVDSFLSRVESSIEQRVDERVARHLPQRIVRSSSWVVLWTLIFGVAATAIITTHMSDADALVAVFIIWAALVGINFAHALGRR